MCVEDVFIFSLTDTRNCVSTYLRIISEKHVQYMASPMHPTGLLFSTYFQRAPGKKIAEQSGASKGQWLVGILRCEDIKRL